jgi:hypothetical protein
VGDASLWVEHIHRFWPDEADGIIRWLAWQVQRPGEKINWALVLGSLYEGVGKDLLLVPFAHALGNAFNGGLSYEHYISGYDDGLLNKTFVVMQEAQQPTRSDAKAIANRLKPLITSPPDALDLNPKGQARVTIRNVVNIAIVTNHADALYLSAHGRRYGVAWTSLPPMDQDYYDRLGAFVHSPEGADAVLGYLMSLDLGEEPRVAPQWAGLTMMQDASKSEMQTLIEGFVEENDVPVVSVTHIKNWLSAKHGMTKVTGHLVAKVLRDDIGWMRVGGPGWRYRHAETRQKHVLFSPDGKADQWTLEVLDEVLGAYQEIE